MAQMAIRQDLNQSVLLVSLQMPRVGRSQRSDARRVTFGRSEDRRRAKWISTSRTVPDPCLCSHGEAPELTR